MHMTFSSNFLNSVWTHFCSRDAFYQLSFLQHSDMCLFTNTCSSQGESLSITYFLNMTLIFSQIETLVPTNLKVRSEQVNPLAINQRMDQLPATMT